MGGVTTDCPTLSARATLSQIIATWAGLKVEYTPFKTTGVNVLVQPSDIYEALDDNEVALQNMMGNRFMGFFEQTITEWKGKLGTVRSVLEVWLEVQRSWCSLESIFLGCELIAPIVVPSCHHAALANYDDI